MSRRGTRLANSQADAARPRGLSPFSQQSIRHYQARTEPDMNYTTRTRVNAPASQVFDACTGFESAPERVSGIKSVEMLTEGPTRVGTRFKETRVIMKKEASETMEVVALEPGRSVTLSASSCGMNYKTKFEFHPAGDGASDIVFTMDAKPLTLGARILAPLMALMMGGMMKKLIAQDIADIKAWVESRA